MNRPLISYAQNREDLILEGFFPDIAKGFYVDVGANHPIKDSVTKLFYKKGWRGIHIEPNASLAAILRLDRPDETVVNEGVSNKNGTLTFTEYANHGLSTFSKTMTDGYKSRSNVFTDTFRTYEVPVRTLADIFAKQGVVTIHFMKVDAEGYEYEVLDGNNWTIYRPEMICIESNHIVKDWRPLLQKHGYFKVFHDGLNEYYLADEAKAREAHFSYAERLLESGEVLRLPAWRALEVARIDRAISELRLDEERRRRRQAEHQASWYEEAPLRWMLIKTAKAIDRAITKRMTLQPHNEPSFDVEASVPEASLQQLTMSYRNSVTSRLADAPGLGRAIASPFWLAYRVGRRAARLAVRNMRRGKK